MKVSQRWGELITRFSRRVQQVANAVLLLLCVAAPLLIVYHIGFPTTPEIRASLDLAYRSILSGQWMLVTLLVLLGNVQRAAATGKLSSRILRIGGYLVFTLIVVLNIALQNGWIAPDGFTSVATSGKVMMITLLAVSITELSRSITSMLGRRTSPPLILAGSFMLIILIGSLLLMLPNATLVDISYIDSLFLSTSAVCVTGLTPVDVSVTLTTTGFIILLMLIQIGGLGVMTITSFFGLFFVGGRSFAGQMVVGDLLSTNKMSGLLRMLANIIMVTLAIEATGAVMLYMSIAETGTMSHGSAWFFAIFHSISAFCNAGFSTLSGGLADPVVVQLNAIRYVVSFLIIFGGIGFPIFSNFLHLIAHRITNLFRRAYGIRPKFRPRLWTLNSYIVVRTTLFLVVGGWVAFLTLEWNASLADFDVMGKLSQSFLMSVTPRTAGFNGVSMTQMLPVSLVLTIVLMWIGGAPQSTAGGIKVTTAYVALKNIFSSNRSTGELNIHGRRIPLVSVERAFAVMALSVITITTAVVIMSIAEPNLSVGKLVFEAVSAISTVGLSVDVTPELGAVSKYVLIFLMFVGRVGLLSILVLFVRPSALRAKSYTYPEENILIT